MLATNAALQYQQYPERGLDLYQAHTAPILTNIEGTLIAFIAISACFKDAKIDSNLIYHDIILIQHHVSLWYWTHPKIEHTSKIINPNVRLIILSGIYLISGIIALSPSLFKIGVTGNAARSNIAAPMIAINRGIILSLFLLLLYYTLSLSTLASKSAFRITSSW